MLYPIIHIVKRFGRVGGMESYVWHLVHGLAKSGLQVIVICEQVCESSSAGIRVIELQAAPERPRWKSMTIFRDRVEQAIRSEFKGQSVIIHSHERSVSHQVTTFHGPPMVPPAGLQWPSRFGRRFRAWRQMEREEVLGPNVQLILSVSTKVNAELLRQHPDAKKRKLDLAWPGVASPSVDSREVMRMHLDETKFVFVGKEWKRKGLDIAVSIVEKFRQVHSRASLTVYGVARAELPRSIRLHDWVIVEGWSSCISWSRFDVLLHPARNEPFGMVVAEARANGLPVLMSSHVGAADLDFSRTYILDLDIPIISWCEAVPRLLSTTENVFETKWTWSDLVRKHIEVFYPQLEAISL